MRFSCLLRTYRSSKLWNPIHGRQPSRRSADEAVTVINSNSDVFVHSLGSAPTELLEALCRRVDSDGLTSIRLNHFMLRGPIPWADKKYWGKIRSNCFFLNQETRELVKEGQADFVPVFLKDVPVLHYNGFYPIDVALISVSPPGIKRVIYFLPLFSYEHGFCSMGINVDATFSAACMAKKIIALVNPTMPRIHGDGMIHMSHFDSVVETTRPIYGTDGEHFDKVSKKIGSLIAENLVEDGATLQMGTGGIPGATLHALKDHKDLGVHTEFLTEGIMELMQLGVVNNSKKKIMAGKSVSSIASGSQKFYDFLDNNTSFHFGCCGWTNHTYTVSKNPKMTCINSALEVDLTGQICADSIGSTFFSGFGGQMDFMSSAGMTEDGKGKAIISMTSRTTKGKAKIVPVLSEGAGVVTTRGHIHYVVTEYGIAELWGRSVRQRARALIDIAHPDDREELEKAAFKRLKCMPSK